jgi:dolichol-phosphate mannosyltransferase
MTDSLSITIVMPAFNEQKNIELSISNSLQAIDDFALDGELICVNDGSSDETLKIIKKCRNIDKRIKVISHPSPRGFGVSFWDGVDKAKNEIVVVMPGDNENDPWEILRYIYLLKDVDIVIPFVFNAAVRPRYRVLVSSLYRFIVNFTFMTSFNYTNGTVLYRKRLLLDLAFRSGGFFFQTDILIRLVKMGYLFAEVPYRLGFSDDKVSNAISFPSLAQVIRGYLVLLWDIYCKRVVRKHAVGSATLSRYKDTN